MEQEKKPPSRRTTRGFAERTRRNLELAKDSYGVRKDFHVVTQLVNSLLGIVAIPWQRHSEQGEHDFESDIPHRPLQEGMAALEIHRNGRGEGEQDTDGPRLEPQERGSSRTLRLHRGPRFSPPARSDNQGRQRDRWKTPPWSYEIRRDKLYEFCVKLSKYIEANPVGNGT